MYDEAKLKPPKIVIAKNLNQHKRQVQDAKKKHNFEFVQQEFGLGYESWLCLYEFLEKIKYTHNEKYMRYVNMMKKGIFSAVFTDTHAFLCELPEAIRFNEQEQLHSINAPAIQMPNGDDYFFIKGVRFDKKLWEKVVGKKMSFKEIMKIDNMEQRYIAFELYGPEKLLKEAQTTVIDTYESTSKNLNKTVKIRLHEVPDLIRNQKVKLLDYKCHSTARPYVKFVPNEMATVKDAMAWAFQIKPEEYEKLEIQS